MISVTADICFDGTARKDPGAQTCEQQWGRELKRRCPRAITTQGTEAKQSASSNDAGKRSKAVCEQQQRMENEMSTLVEYKKKKVIFNEGDESDCMYGVTEGSVGIYSDYGTSKEKQLVTLQCGDYFGEMGMIERLPRSATAVALENCALKRMEISDMEELLKENPAKVYAIIQHTGSRIRSVTLDYVAACACLKEYVEAEENGTEKSKALINNMKKIAAEGTRRK